MAQSLVQSKSAAGTSTTPSVTMTSSPAQGDLLVVVITAGESAGDVTMSTPPTGYTLVPTDGDQNSTAHVHQWMYYKIAGAGESSTVSATISASRGWAISVGQFNDGVGGTWTLDTSTHGAAAQSTTSDSGTTATTAQANEVWVAGLSVNNASTATPTNSFILQENPTTGVGTNPDVTGALLYKIVTATGTANTGLTNSASRFWVGAVVTFYSLVTRSDVPTRRRSLGLVMRRPRRRF